MGIERDLDRVVFEDHRHDLEFEHELINRKITWLLTSQSILFAALGLTIRAESLALVYIIGGVGLAICVTILLSIAGSVRAKKWVSDDYAHWAASEGTNPHKWGVRGTGNVEWGVRTRITRFGVLLDLFIPLIFIFGWIVVLMLAGSIVDDVKS